MYANFDRDGRAEYRDNQSVGELRLVLQDVGLRSVRSSAPQDYWPVYRQSIDEDGFYCVPIRDEDLRNASCTKEERVVSGVFRTREVGGENL